MRELTTDGKIELGAYVSEWAQTADGRWVHKYSILGTTHVVYEAWERYEGGYVEGGRYVRSHSTIRTHEGVTLGKVMQRELPDDLDALKPGSDERIRAVTAWHASLEREDHALVLEVFGADFE